MRSRLLIIASLFVLPTLATAQRGGSRTQSDRHTDLFDKSSLPKAPLLRTRDIEAQSPLKLLIDKRKDLKLSEAQMAAHAVAGWDAVLADASGPSVDESDQGAGVDRAAPACRDAPAAAAARGSAATEAVAVRQACLAWSA